MIAGERNFAYIDAANLHKGVKNLGWELDYARFRIWLKEKYNVTQAYLFIGLIPKNKDLYTALQRAGFVLVFKEITYDGLGKVKGNCDADLVLQAARDLYEADYNKAILISSDGDYASLVKFLDTRGKFKTVLSSEPPGKCSILLKKIGVKIAYVGDQQSILEKR